MILKCDLIHSAVLQADGDKLSRSGVCIMLFPTLVRTPHPRTLVDLDL